MASSFADLEKEVRSLGSREKAALAHILIQDLDTSADENTEQIWVEQARKRYQEFKEGKIEALPGDEVMHRARQHLK